MNKPRLTNLQKAKISLAYLAWEDMDKLNKPPHNRLLKHVLGSTLGEINRFFRQAGESSQDVIRVFRTWELTLYPKISIGFDPDRNVLIINLWSWMFSVLSNMKQLEVGFSPLCLKASELIHEFQHYVYLDKHKMLEASDEESELFRSKHGGIMEETAFRKQIAVLKTYKKVAPLRIPMIAFKIDAWENGGRCTFRFLKESQQATETLIDGLVKQYEEAIELAKLDTGASRYNEESDRMDCQMNETISQALNLPIDVSLDKDQFKTTSVYF